jgi:hypothetical protein
MIAQIGPLVQAGEQKKKLLIAHIVGGVAGGSAVGAVLGVVAVASGSMIHAGTSFEVAGLASCVAAAGVMDLRRVGKREWITRQTPRGWTCAMGTTPGVLAWGIDLGLGFTTRLPAMSFVALPLSCIVLHSFGLSVAVMSAYGLARGAGVTAAVVLSRDVARICGTLAVRARLVRAVAGLAALITSAVLLSSI